MYRRVQHRQWYHRPSSVTWQCLLCPLCLLCSGHHRSLLSKFNCLLNRQFPPLLTLVVLNFLNYSFPLNIFPLSFSTSSTYPLFVNIQAPWRRAPKTPGRHPSLKHSVSELESSLIPWFWLGSQCKCPQSCFLTSHIWGQRLPTPVLT